MKNGQQRKRCFSLVPVVLYLFMCAGCGYSVHRHADLPYKEIGIGLIENRTLEPKLGDKLYKALAEEFLAQGIVFNNASPYKLTGVINKYGMTSLSEKNGITIEYSLQVSADFRLVDNEGKVLEIKNISSPFFVSFAGSEDLAGLLASRELAEEKAMRDIASEVVGALIYK